MAESARAGRGSSISSDVPAHAHVPSTPCAVEARFNFTARRDALAATGAQLLLTDFPVCPSNLFFPSNYSVYPVLQGRRDQRPALCTTTWLHLPTCLFSTQVSVPERELTLEG